MSKFTLAHALDAQHTKCFAIKEGAKETLAFLLGSVSKVR
jgi:hypothetical protein